MKALHIYFSSTGNTEKVVEAINRTLGEENVELDSLPAKEAQDVDLLAYDLLFLGSGVYEWLPGNPLQNLLADLRKWYVQQGEIKPASPKRPGIKGVVYCTYGGAHTGINEALPAVKYMAQIFDHLGIEIVGEWYIVGEYHGKLAEFSQTGRLGDIRGRPDERDLNAVAELVRGILKV